MTEEIWKPIAGFPDYEVSSEGRVRWIARMRGGRRTPATLRASPSHNGYLRVRLWSCGEPFFRRVHLLVLEAFVGPRPSPRHHGAHGPDRDVTNNRRENLRWALPEENEADKRAHGTWRTGPRRALSARQVANIRRRCDAGDSYSAIAKDYGVHRHSISRIHRGLRHAPESRAAA